MAAAGIRDGVQVNVINPGTVRTDRYQKRLIAFAAEHGMDTARAEREFVREHNTTRIGEPEDIAALVAFVARPEARFLHGAMVDMDGGATKTT
jgi:3-oxoacyl-[acyl-carrier protein] reductase